MDDRSPIGARLAWIPAALVLASAVAWAQGNETPGPRREEAAGAAHDGRPAFEREPILGRDGGAPAATGQAAKPGGDDVSILPFFLWTGVIVLAICGALALVRRVFPATRGLFPNPAIRVIGKRAIAANASIVLVEVGSRILRLGLSKEGLVYLGEIADPVEIALVKGKAIEAAPESASRTFSQELAAGVKEAEEAPKPPPPTTEETEEREEDIRAELDQIKRTLEGWRA